MASRRQGLRLVAAEVLCENESQYRDEYKRLPGRVNHQPRKKQIITTVSRNSNSWPIRHANCRKQGPRNQPPRVSVRVSPKPVG